MLPEEAQDNLHIQSHTIDQAHIALIQLKAIVSAHVEFQQARLDQLIQAQQGYEEEIVKPSNLTIHGHNYHHETYCTEAVKALTSWEEEHLKLSEFIKERKAILTKAVETTIIIPISQPLPVISLVDSDSEDGSLSSGSSDAERTE